MFFGHSFQFTRCKRSSSDLLKSIRRFTAAQKRLRDAWMEMLTQAEIHDIGFLADLQVLNSGRMAAQEQPMAPDARGIV